MIAPKVAAQSGRPGRKVQSASWNRSAGTATLARRWRAMSNAIFVGAGLARFALSRSLIQTVPLPIKTAPDKIGIVADICGFPHLEWRSGKPISASFCIRCETCNPGKDDHINKRRAWSHAGPLQIPDAQTRRPVHQSLAGPQYSQEGC